MMADMTSAKPRPRPPAKARRTSSLQSLHKVPPPPYAPSLNQVILDTTTDATLAEDDPGSLGRLPLTLPTPEVEEWMNERSREEIADLLLKADELIKSRESELTLTSALCKTLYHDNITLKEKHETLLARIPASPSHSRSPPGSPAPAFAGSPTGTPPSYDPSLPDTDAGDSSPPSARRPPRRRVSVSPADLVVLADQNAELLDKLERLEAEAAHADQAGRRKLRKLEREIQNLRDELEQTRAKEAELERQARSALSRSAGEVQRRREEREARVRVLKERVGSASESDAAVEEVRDFAPPPELPTRSFSLKFTSPPLRRAEVAEPAPTLSNQSNGSSFTSSTNPSRPSTPPQAAVESDAIVSQLLAKVRELEETNAQIKEEQQLTEERLRSAQFDAESIKRMYECLTGTSNVDLNAAPQDELEGTQDPSGGTVKFSIMQQSIREDVGKLFEHGEPDKLSEEVDVTEDAHGTTRSDVAHNPISSHKTRKSVVGLFNSGPRSRGKGRWMEHPRRMLLSPSRPRTPEEQGDTELGEFAPWSAAETDNGAPPSPLGSGLNTPLEGPGFGHSLGSELGSEYGDDWGATAENHHLRTSSLYNLDEFSGPREGGVSPSASELPLFVFPSTGDAVSLAAGAAPAGSTWDPGASTPPRAQSLQLTVEPPTPALDSLTRPGSLRAHRLSQVVMARTHRWVEGRFSPPPAGDAPLRRTAARMRRRSTLDASVTMADLFTDESRRSAGSSGRRGRIPSFEREDGGERAVQVRADASGAVESDCGKKEGLTGFVIEVWLWLQFVIVIMLFLWTMAKRGPKSVLVEAERRTTAGGRP